MRANVVRNVMRQSVRRRSGLLVGLALLTAAVSGCSARPEAGQQQDFGNIPEENQGAPQSSEPWEAEGGTEPAAGDGTASAAGDGADSASGSGSGSSGNGGGSSSADGSGSSSANGTGRPGGSGSSGNGSGGSGGSGSSSASGAGADSANGSEGAGGADSANGGGAEASWMAAYQRILDEYEGALANRESLEEHSADYPDINYLAVMLTQGKADAIRYAYYDIDGNGTPELLLGLDWEVLYQLPEMKIMDVYACDGTAAKKLFDDETLAERSSLTIYQDGAMYIYGSGGAADGEAAFYVMAEDGYSTVVEKSYVCDYRKDPDRPFYNEQEALTEEEFEALTGGRAAVEGLEWKSLGREG